MVDSDDEQLILKNWLEILIKKMAKKINKKMKGNYPENHSLIDKATTFVEETLLAKMDNFTSFIFQKYNFSMEDLFKDSLTGFKILFLLFPCTYFSKLFVFSYPLNKMFLKET